MIAQGNLDKTYNNLLFESVCEGIYGFSQSMYLGLPNDEGRNGLSGLLKAACSILRLCFPEWKFVRDFRVHNYGGDSFTAFSICVGYIEGQVDVENVEKIKASLEQNMEFDKNGDKQNTPVPDVTVIFGDILATPVEIVMTGKIESGVTKLEPGPLNDSWVQALAGLQGKNFTYSITISTKEAILQVLKLNADTSYFHTRSKKYKFQLDTEDPEELLLCNVTKIVDFFSDIVNAMYSHCFAI